MLHSLWDMGNLGSEVDARIASITVPVGKPWLLATSPDPDDSCFVVSVFRGLLVRLTIHGLRPVGARFYAGLGLHAKLKYI